VLCVGAGGLGSTHPVLSAAAGVGTIGIAEGDLVDDSNLQRQIIHFNRGRWAAPKLQSAKETNRPQINPGRPGNGTSRYLDAANAVGNGFLPVTISSSTER